MPDKSDDRDERFADQRIVLGVLDAFERDGRRTQRNIASDLGIALGLANACVKRCVRKGLLKVSQIPAGRYAYYLTPEGFAEKSRLTAEYLTTSFSFFRHARADCALMFDEARQRGWKSVCLVGASEVAEVAALCAVEAAVPIVAIVDSNASGVRLVGIPVVPAFGDLARACDGAIVTSIDHESEVTALAIAEFGARRVLVPALLKAPQRRMPGPAVAAEAS